MFFEVGEDHLHLLLLLVLILTSEGRVAVALHISIVDNHRLRPYFDILIGRVVNFNMKVIRSAANGALLIKCSQLLKKEAAQWRIFFRVKHLMLILNAAAYLRKIIELVLEAMRPSPCIFLESSLGDFRVIGKITLHVVDLLVAHVLLLDIAEDIVMELCVKTEEHLRVV